MTLLNCNFKPVSPVFASGVFLLPRAFNRMDEIMGTLTDLYQEDRLERIAAIDLDRLAHGIMSPIPIRGVPNQMQLWTSDHDALVSTIKTAPSDPKDRGEFIYSTIKAFYIFYQAVPTAVQDLLDAYLVAQGLLPPIRPRYVT